MGEEGGGDVYRAGGGGAGGGVAVRRSVWGRGEVYWEGDIHLKVSVRASTAGVAAAGFATWKKESKFNNVRGLGFRCLVQPTTKHSTT